MTNNITESLILILGDAGFLILKKSLLVSIAIIIYIFIYKISKKLVNNFFIQTRNKSEKFKIDDRRLVTLNIVSLSIIKYILYFFVGTSIISFFGGTESVKSIVTVAGIGGVAVGFGAQSLVKDIITGFFILLEDQISVGDIVQISGIAGTVEEIGIRTTKLRSINGDLHIIPNGQITIVTNMTREFKRAIVEVGITYEDKIEYIITILEDEMNNIFQNVTGLHEVPQILGVSAFNESAVVIKILAKCDIKENFRIENEIRKYIKIRFDKENIKMPYPHRTIEIKSMELL